ncbi:MAG TPA: right-handed parallel beta-helix repeat-containing protein [Kofleriaceae bacterium]|jgi:hypothetical protein|nr:right-handed parallel beta-helix repeat-containing protein [Kofleriaceae bacterium]
MVRLLLLMVPLALLAGCTNENPDFCKNFPGKEGCPGEPMNGGTCSFNTDCTGTGFPICDTSMNEGTCVLCTMADSHLCTGATPVCTNEGKCTGCTKHADCTESNACMPDGSCASADNVAYVDGTNGLDSNPCTKSKPCTKIDKAATFKSIVKVSGTVADRCSLMSTNATIVADPEAKIAPQEGAPGANGIVFEVKGTSNIQVFDLQISNSLGGGSNNIAISDTANLTLTRVTVRDGSANGISVMGGRLTCSQCTITSNASRGIDASMSGQVTLERSTISQNVSGGVRIADDVSFQIVSNMFFHNGQSDKTAAGGLIIAVNPKKPGDPANQLDFNTFSSNRSGPTPMTVQGISCTVGTTMKVSNNVIWNNGDMGQSQVNTDGQCDWEYSDIGPTQPGVSLSNLILPPTFLNEAMGNLHLTSTSPLLGKADPAADLTGIVAKDFDGESRVAKPNMGADIGADQYYPTP